MERRAALALACGDPVRAAALGGDGWRQLADGQVLEALRLARADGEKRSAAMRLLEAETLVASGAMVAGLRRLEQLSATGDAAGTVALARRRHALADHAGAERAAQALPLHAASALVGARAALALNRIDAAFRFVEPYLLGAAPIPDAMAAGGISLLVASILARSRRFEQLERFARALLEAPDLPEDMAPSIARLAWTAGLGAEAWERFSGESQWTAAARVELAVLSGNAALARRWSQPAGALAAPAEPAVRLLSGNVAPDPAATGIFRKGAIVHVWRTHPHRWQPWIEAAMATPADISVFDLGKGVVPDRETVPHLVVDDGSLIDLLPPQPAPAQPSKGAGIWIEAPLAEPTGVGHAWPKSEMERLGELGRRARSPISAAVRICGAEAALREASAGRPTIVAAPPGDPFWAGPLPERVWPAIRVIRMDSRHGWRGAADRAAKAMRELTGEG